MKSLIRSALQKYRSYRHLQQLAADRASYLSEGRKPWSRGYGAYKASFVREILNEEHSLARFRNGDPLPHGFGSQLDERVIEHPWVVSHLRDRQGRLLDAGAGLNFDYVLLHPAVSDKEITIVTLEPESQNFYRNRVGYLYHDLRKLPFKDDWFNTVVSVSTIEHVGMDNSLYSSDTAHREIRKESFLSAIDELKRVLCPGGTAFISLPFGRYTDNHWFQQFDSALLRKLLDRFGASSETVEFYKYVDGGWTRSTEEECKNCEYFNWQATRYCDPKSTKDYDPDFAAAARAVALISLTK